MRKNRDIFWKGIIQEVFDDLLRFVFPKADELFDLKRKVSFLDKELAELYPEPDKSSATRLVDKLVQVHRRDGRKEFLLVHLEVQGKSERDFPERMFQYYYRIFDRWRQPVTAVAIFTGLDGHRIPDRYIHRFMGTELTYKYNVLRVGALKAEELAASPNPFARVMLIVGRALQAGRITEDQLLEYKKELATELLAMKDLPQRKLLVVLNFLNNYIVLEKRGVNRNYEKHVEKLKEKRYTMNMSQAVRLFQLANARDEVRMEEQEKLVKQLIAKTKFSDEEIAKVVEVRVTTVRRLRKAVTGKKITKQKKVRGKRISASA